MFDKVEGWLFVKTSVSGTKTGVVWFVLKSDWKLDFDLVDGGKRRTEDQHGGQNRYMEELVEQDSWELVVCCSHNFDRGSPGANGDVRWGGEAAPCGGRYQSPCRPCQSYP